MTRTSKTASLQISESAAPADKKDYGKPLSQVLRERLNSQRIPFAANDNISMVMLDGDKDKMIEEVAQHVQGMLDALCIDTKNDHNTQGTARRHAKMLVNEVFSGRYDEEPAITSFPNAKNLDQLYMVGPITLHSTCSHHLCPIIGEAYIGVLGGENVLGLSKFNRITRHIAQRPQIQEELTMQLARRVMELSGARGVAVMVKSSHFCSVIRGVKDPATKMVTTELVGDLLNPSLKQEFYAQVDRASKP